MRGLILHLLGKSTDTGAPGWARNGFRMRPREHSRSTVLYLTYDGLTDPLGESQILPYLMGLAAKSHNISILSAEKPKAYKVREQAVASKAKAAGIEWLPLTYHKSPPILSTCWDLLRMRREALGQFRKSAISLVHCRSYLTALIGQDLKRKAGSRFLFDMRGFWPDERADGGIWNIARFPYSAIYRFFKRKEREFLEEADAVISLTEAAKEEMLTWRIPGLVPNKITVIPCSCDSELFNREGVSPKLAAELRAELQLQEDDFILVYLGSIGTWYLVEEMLAFFKCLLAHRPTSKFLFLTNQPNESVLEKAILQGIRPDSLRITNASRERVPAVLSIANASISFIKPTYSKMSSSPTKVAEALAMGLPVISNAGVGDSEGLCQAHAVGPLLRGFKPDDYTKAVLELDQYLELPNSKLRETALNHFSLSDAVEKYHSVYASLK